MPVRGCARRVGPVSRLQAPAGHQVGFGTWLSNRPGHCRELPGEIAMIGNVIGVLFDGIAYGSLLFMISIGLSVTMGLMNFVNLAHGAFAMVGGYACVLAMTRVGVPFLATLPIAFVASAARRHRARAHALSAPVPASPLDQVLFSIGLVFIVDRGGDLHLRSVAAAGAAASPTCSGQVHILGLDLGAYRLFLIARRRDRDARRCTSSSSARASARRCAHRSTTRPRPPGSGSTSIACSR